MRAKRQIEPRRERKKDNEKEKEETGTGHVGEGGEGSTPGHGRALEERSAVVAAPHRRRWWGIGHRQQETALRRHAPGDQSFPFRLLDAIDRAPP